MRPDPVARNRPGRLAIQTVVRTCPQPGEQRLVERLRHPNVLGRPERADNLLDIKRHAVAAIANRRPVVGHNVGNQRRHQIVRLFIGQRRQIDDVGGPAVGQPGTWASGYHDQHPALGRDQQRLQHLDGRWIEPVHVLGHHQPGTVAHTGKQVGPHRFADQLVQLLTFGAYGFVAGLGADTQDRRQQRHHVHGIQCPRMYLGLQQRQSLGRLGETPDATPDLQQGSHRVQADIGMQWGPGQFQHDAAGTLDEFGGLRRQPALTDAGLAAQHHAGGGQRARLRPLPCAGHLRQFAFSTHQRTSPYPVGVGSFTENPMMDDRFVNAFHRRRNGIGNHGRIEFANSLFASLGE